MASHLSLNLDPVVVLREAGNTGNPDPVHAAVVAELAGAHGVACHLRSNRSTVQERDVRILRQTVKTSLNLEIAPNNENIQFATDILPDRVTLVAEKDPANPKASALDALVLEKEIKSVIDSLHRNNTPVCLFVDPDIKQIKAASRSGAALVEVHTGYYANASGEKQVEEHYRLANAVVAAHKLGLRVHMGAGLNYGNVESVAKLDGVEELHVGHAIVAKASLVGLDRAIREMIDLIG